MSRFPLLLLVTVFSCGLAAPAPAALTVTLDCVADAFIRASVPEATYGAGGSLNVSGPSATNSGNEVNGEFASFLRFATATAGPLFDADLGTGLWQVTGATLRLTEVAQPGNQRFNIGAGRSLVQWIADDTWLEGTGNASTPAADGITWQTRSPYIVPAATETTGELVNTAANGVRTVDLTLTPRFLADLMAGGDVSFYLSALTGTTGFNFRSRDYLIDPTAQPALLLTASAIPEPGTAGLLMLLAAARGCSRRR